MNYYLTTGDENFEFLFGNPEKIEDLNTNKENIESNTGGILIPCKSKDEEKIKLFCESPCGAITMIEGFSGTGKTILACNLCCETIKSNLNDDDYAILYTLDQSSNTILKLIKSFNFLNINEIKVLESIKKLEEQFIKEIKLYIRELSNISRLDQLLEYMQNDFSREDKQISYPRIIVIDSINTVLRKNESFRNDLLQILDFPKWKIQNDKSCCLENRPISKILTFEKTDEAGAIEEYLCDCVIDLKKNIKGVRPFRVLEIKKSRGQKSYIGSHEFEIKTEKKEEAKENYNRDNKVKERILVYPSLHSQSKSIPVMDQIGTSENEGENFGIPKDYLNKITKQINTKFKLTKTKILIPKGTTTLLWGEPGTYKTWIGANFVLQPYIHNLLIKSQKRKNNKKSIFITFKIPKETFLNYLTDIVKKRKNNQEELSDEEINAIKEKIIVINANDPFESPSSVFVDIKKMIDKKINGGITIERVVVFGIKRLYQIPAYKNIEWEFMEVLVKYFQSQNITTLLITWSGPGPDPGALREQPMEIDLCANVIKTNVITEKIEYEKILSENERNEIDKIVNVEVERRNYRVKGEKYYLIKKKDGNEPF